MNRYRIEILSRSDLSLVSFRECAEPDINIDFLVSAQSAVSCPGQVVGEIGDFAQIRINGRVYYQGVIYDIGFDGSKTAITLLQLSQLMNTEVFADVDLLSSQTIEQWFSALLADTFNGTDSSANLPGYTVKINSSTNGYHAASDDGVYNLYDLAVSFFKTYGVIIDISFDYNTKKVLFEFNTVSNTVLKLDLTVSDVIDYEIQPALISDSLNRMIIRDADDPTNVITYYWHPTDFSGTIDTDPDTNRIVPVITRCEEITLNEGEIFADVSYAKAQEVLYKTRYDDLISVTIKADSKLISNFQIGQLFTLYDGDNSYNTLLTGIHKQSMASIGLTFGYVRKRLTQILKMKGRY